MSNFTSSIAELRKTLKERALSGVGIKTDDGKPQQTCPRVNIMPPNEMEEAERRKIINQLAKNGM